jgi:hypothetical protein
MRLQSETIGYRLPGMLGSRPPALPWLALTVVAAAFGCGASGADTANVGGASQSGSAGVASTGTAGAGGAIAGSGGVTGSSGSASGGKASAGAPNAGAGPTGGTNAAGGASPSGGTAPSAGSSNPSGGNDSAGGSAGSAGVSGGAGTGAETPVECSIEASASVAQKIASVVAVTFTSDLPGATEAYVEFGEDTAYGFAAPVALDAADPRALLLGMPFESEVHYRVVVKSAAGVCRGEDATITTGAPPQGAPAVMPTVAREAEVTPGFIVLGVTGGWATIYNHEGDLVWAYKTSLTGVMPRVDFTYDASFIIGRDGNPSGQAGGQIRRIALDGATDEPIALDRSHHDFTATPDNGIVFFTGHTDNCGKLVKMSADGAFTDLFTVADAFGSLSGMGNDLCHMNSLHYHAFDDSISFSVLTQNAYVKISSGGELQWVLGGDASDFSGDGAEWTRQHGHAMPDERHVLFFNNRSNNQTALAVEVELDLEAMTARRVLEYEGGGSSQTLGDVQRLPNGNTLVTYCNDGLQHEINPEQELVRSFAWSGGVGYATHRPMLYGPPPER